MKRLGRRLAIVCGAANLATTTSGTRSCDVVGSGSSCAAAPALVTARRGRFYRPLVSQGINLWRSRMGRLHKGWTTWEYNRDVVPDPRPFPEPAVNNYYGRSRIWNPIAGKIGIVNRKADEWGWPHQRPPPTGLRRSPEYFPFFFSRYFPDVEVRLVLDSVLNNETTRPVFHIPQDMSKQELVNYLKNIYNIDNVVRISVRNMRGRRFKNEVGEIKNLPDYKVAVVELDSPVSIVFKQIKGTEDTPDNKPTSQLALISMASSKAFCRACLVAYSTLMLTITTGYLWMQWGTQRGFAEVQNEVQHRNDGSADVNGIAFADSGGADYALVALFHALHFICLALFLLGHKSRMNMVVGCALLLSCAILYIILYGCIILQVRLEQEHQRRSLVSAEAVAAFQPKPGKSISYQAEVEFADSATAVAGAATSPFNGEQREVSRASAKGASGHLGRCGAAPVHADDPFSYGSIGWMVLEALIDVLAAIVNGFDRPMGNGEASFHSDGALIPSQAPFSRLFHFSLFVLNCTGFALSMWGVLLFDASSASASAPAIASAGLTASALSQLATDRGASAAGVAVGSATPVTPPTAAAAEAKKAQ